MAAARRQRPDPEIEAIKADLEKEKIRSRTKIIVALVGKIPWIVVSTAQIVTAVALAGEKTIVDFEVITSVTLTLAIPAGLIKVVLDRKEKQRLRDRCTTLEQENRSLQEKCTGLEEQLRGITTGGDPSGDDGGG